MPTNPRSETRLIQNAGSEVEHRKYAFGIGRHQLEAIQQEKQFDRDEGRSFVAVNEWMVAEHASSQDRGEPDDPGRLGIGQVLLRTGQGGPQQPGVMQARRSAIQRQQPVVQGQAIALIGPYGRSHFMGTITSPRR